MNNKKIIIASNNKHKIKEIKEILTNYEIISMEEIGFKKDIEENGKSFVENALIKAESLMQFLKEKNIDLPCLSDDSGLCVDALNGKPGIFSARYSGEHGNDKANRQKLLNELKNQQNRNAHFECAIVKLFPNGKYIIGLGKTYGQITNKEIGENGFGYDSIFLSSQLNKTFAECSEEEKNSVSHRKKALINLIENENI